MMTKKSPQNFKGNTGNILFDFTSDLGANLKRSQLVFGKFSKSCWENTWLAGFPHECRMYRIKK